jgi:hypothetical protein
MLLKLEQGEGEMVEKLNVASQYLVKKNEQSQVTFCYSVIQ